MHGEDVDADVGVGASVGASVGVGADAGADAGVVFLAGAVICLPKGCAP